MIERKRLEELIQQVATVCCAYIDCDNNWNYRFGKVIKEGNYLLFMENSSSLSIIMYDTCNLYETKEEAEWYKEFGCIERTERLVLPNFEEFNKCDKSVKFVDSKGTRYSMYVFVKNKKTNNCRIIIYADNGEQDWLVFEQPLTQENYTLACRKAKELFLNGDEK